VHLTLKFKSENDLYSATTLGVVATPSRGSLQFQKVLYRLHFPLITTTLQYGSTPARTDPHYSSLQFQTNRPALSSLQFQTVLYRYFPLLLLLVIGSTPLERPHYSSLQFQKYCIDCTSHYFCGGSSLQFQTLEPTRTTVAYSSRQYCIDCTSHYLLLPCNVGQPQLEPTPTT
ncbi:hypothetical protein J6590_065467, partial [Homalodisca vitripennis]